MMATTLSHLTATNARVESLRADFEGLEKLNDIINDVLKRLQARGEVQQAWSTMNMQNFDGWFEPIVRKELGKVLGIVRNKAVAKARTAGAGSVIISQLTLNGPLGTADYTSQFQGYGPYTVAA